MPAAASRAVYLRHAQVHGERPAGGGSILFALQVYVWWLLGHSDRYVSGDLKYVKALFCCDRTTPTTAIFAVCYFSSNWGAYIKSLKWGCWDATGYLANSKRP